MLGGGGFGITYLGFQVELGRRVAIKEYLPIRCAKRDPKSGQVIPSEDESYADMFQRGAKAFLDEARILGSLDHPNVVDVIDRFERDGTAYLVMKYYEGSLELRDYCARQNGGKLPWRRAIRLLLPVLAGLKKVHDKGLMHRDIKPGNLLHLPDPEDKLILIDFGLARAVDRERGHSFAVPGVEVVGTARYAAPEQWLKLQSIYGKPSSKSDIYGVATTLYHLLTSERPMTAEERLLAKARGREDPLPPARGFTPDLPAKLDDALQKALELEQEKRFESVAEFAWELWAVLQQELPQELPPKKPGVWERFFGRRSRSTTLTPKKPVESPPPSPQPSPVPEQRNPQTVFVSDPVQPPPLPPPLVPREPDSLTIVTIAPPAVKPPEPEPVPPPKPVVPPLPPVVIAIAPPVVKPPEPKIVVLPPLKPVVPSDTAKQIRSDTLKELQAIRDKLNKLKKINKINYLYDRRKAFRDLLKDGSQGPAMIVIPGGTFLMGSPEGEWGRDDNERQHEVAMDDFVIGQYTVTFAEYDRFCDVTKRKKPDGRGWGRKARPVINVSWHDAREYVAWLCKETGCRYRLPTEAEWEYAARAGTTTPFWTGRCLNADQANYRGYYCYGEPGCGAKTGVCRGKTLPVGSFEPNPWGLYDTMGNVWEWTCSAYDEKYGGAEKARDEDTSGPRVLRGGSWNDGPGRLRSAARHRFDPRYRLPNIGFRLARSL